MRGSVNTKLLLWSWDRADGARAGWLAGAFKPRSSRGGAVAEVAAPKMAAVLPASRRGRRRLRVPGTVSAIREALIARASWPPSARSTSARATGSNAARCWHGSTARQAGARATARRRSCGARAAVEAEKDYSAEAARRKTSFRAPVRLGEAPTGPPRPCRARRTGAQRSPDRASSAVTMRL